MSKLTLVIALIATALALTLAAIDYSSATDSTFLIECEGKSDNLTAFADWYHGDHTGSPCTLQGASIVMGDYMSINGGTGVGCTAVQLMNELPKGLTAGDKTICVLTEWGTEKTKYNKKSSEAICASSKYELNGTGVTQVGTACNSAVIYSTMVAVVIAIASAMF